MHLSFIEMKKAQEANDIALLDLIQEELEESIFNYALESAENLYDEEEDVVIRALHWSVGTSVYVVVIHPLGFIKTVFSMSPDDVEDGELGSVPSDFLLQVTNNILSLNHHSVDDREEPGR